MKAIRHFRFFCRTAVPPLVLALLATAPAAATVAVDATPQALASTMGTRRNVLLGEVHDNGVQHALRALALRRLVEAGARPAIAFEQFDRDQQAEIDRLRQERPGDVDALIAVGARSWEWRQYRPFLQLAVDYELPIVAANLSRADAMKIAAQGWSALFAPPDQVTLGLDRLSPAFVAAHEQAVADGHCNLLPAESLPPMARAQIARDIVLAKSLRSYLGRGVVLLTGNGHVRKDIGVPVWLSPEDRRDLLSIGLLEIGPDGPQGAGDELQQRYDAVVETAAVERPDPCEALRKRLPQANTP